MSVFDPFEYEYEKPKPKPQIDWVAFDEAQVRQYEDDYGCLWGRR